MKRIAREALVSKYGEAKADEILRDRDLGELTYEMDDEQNSDHSDDPGA